MKPDIVIIGGGYYGCVSALTLKAVRPHLNVVILERERQLFSRASSTNQGQLHAGYMYSGFPELARECVHGAQEFTNEYPKAVTSGVVTYYGVHKGSDITPLAYESFCKKAGLPVEWVADPPRDFFGSSLNAVYKTAEKTFDNRVLQRLLTARLRQADISTVTSCTVRKIQPAGDKLVAICGDGQKIQARVILNATFADTNALHEQSGFATLPLEHAVFLHFLVDLPAKYQHTGLIVVRGIYGALVPTNTGSPSHILAPGGLRTVRTAQIDAPSEKVSSQEIKHRYQQAVREMADYIPILRSARLVGHTIGTRANYVNPATGRAESRAVVLKNYAAVNGYHCVFGGKVTCLPEITTPLHEIAAQL